MEISEGEACVCLPYFRTKLRGYYVLVTAGAWDFSGSRNSISFCGQVGLVVCDRGERAWLGENHSALGWCPPAILSGVMQRENLAG